LKLNKVLIRYSCVGKSERQKELIDENLVDEFVNNLKQNELFSNICVFPITIGKLDKENS